MSASARPDSSLGGDEGRVEATAVVHEPERGARGQDRQDQDGPAVPVDEAPQDSSTLNVAIERARPPVGAVDMAARLRAIRAGQMPQTLLRLADRRGPCIMARAISSIGIAVAGLVLEAAGEASALDVLEHGRGSARRSPPGRGRAMRVIRRRRRSGPWSSEARKKPISRKPRNTASISPDMYISSTSASGAIPASRPISNATMMAAPEQRADRLLDEEVERRLGLGASSRWPRPQGADRRRPARASARGPGRCDPPPPHTQAQKPSPAR